MIPALILVAALYGIAAIAAALVWQPRQESAPTRPASSNRKSGRTRAAS